MGLVVLRVGARRARRLLLLAGLVFAALPAGSALADTTIGKAGGETMGHGCFGGVVIGDRNYVVPSGGGRITSFSFQSTSANTGETLDFLVLRPEPVGRYLVVGKTGVVTLKGTGLETFSANISVAGGDILGFWSSELDNCFRAGPTRLILNGPASDPNRRQLFAMRAGDFADLNESANLHPGPGAPPPPPPRRCERGDRDDKSRCRHHHHRRHHHHHHHEKN